MLHHPFLSLACLLLTAQVASAVGAGAVFFNRRYEPAMQAADVAVVRALASDGLHVQSCAGLLLQEPAHVKVGALEQGQQRRGSSEQCSRIVHTSLMLQPAVHVCLGRWRGRIGALMPVALRSHAASNRLDAAA